MTNVSKTLSRSSLDGSKREAENIKFDKEIPKERYLSPEKGDTLLMTLD